MDYRTVPEGKDLQSLPAGASGVVTRCLRDRTTALVDLQRKRRELEEFNAKKEKRKQVLEGLQQRIHELNKKIKEVEDTYISSDMFHKEEEADQAVEKAERERKESLQMDEDLKRLKQECVEFNEIKQELQRQVERHSVYREFMERVVKMTKFEDVEKLTGHIESLLHIRDQLYQKECDAQEQINEQRKVLLTLEDQHHLLRLQMNNQLSQLQAELEESRSEALIWERKWNRIQDTATKKTLLLGQIKMATFNLYEMMCDKIEEEEKLDMNDTVKQLDKIKMFIQDHNDIVKQHQTLSHTQSDGQKRTEK